MSKRTMRWLCLGAVLLAALAGLAVLGIYQLRYRVKTDPLDSYTVLDAEQTKFAWELESCQVENGELSVSGWLVEPGREYDARDGEITAAWNCTWVAVLDEKTETVSRLPTQARVPAEGEPYPQDGIDHKNCGFISKAALPQGKEPPAGEICLAVQDIHENWYLITTGVAIQG